MDLRKLKSKKQAPKANTTGINRYLLFGSASVMLCWFYGIPPLALSWLALRRLWPMRATAASLKPARLMRYRLAWRLSLAGFILSATFTFIYLLGLIKGAYFTY